MRKRIFCVFMLLTLIAASLSSADFKIQYRDGDHGNATDNHIKPHVNIINLGSETVVMSELTLRYYYTKEGAANEVLHIDYAYIGGSCISGTFHDGYLEIGFTSGAGTIPGYGESGEIQIRFNKEDWSNYNETDDYSYKNPATSYADWDRITLYHNGTLLWGLEPGGPTDPPVTPALTPDPTLEPTPDPIPEPTPVESGDTPFVESGGLVVMEAEHYTGKAPGTGTATDSSWVESSSYADSSNGVALKAAPNRGVNAKDTKDGPRLDYDVSFETTGTYYIWVRMWGTSYTNDSLHAGLDGEPASFGKKGITIISCSWEWVDEAAERVTVDVTTPGLHTVNIWMREDGTKFDKLLLTTDPGYVPEGQGPAESPRETPQEPTPEPLPGTGTVWFVPAEITIPRGADFGVEIHVNSGYQTIGAYQLILSYDDTILMVDTGRGSDGVDAGPDGFISAVNPQTPGTLIFNGFDASGTGPGDDLHLVTVYFYALEMGSSTLSLTIDSLIDIDTNIIGSPVVIGGIVTVAGDLLTPTPESTSPPVATPSAPPFTPLPTTTPGDDTPSPTPSTGMAGDVNSDGVIDIVDALLCAQYYVGLNPSNYDPGVSDINYDGSIDIVDALLIAQYYVGLVDEFPGPDPTPEGEPTPVPDPGVGDVWIVPSEQTVAGNSEFTTEIHVNTGSQSLAAFGIELHFDSQYITVNTDIEADGVDDGPDGIGVTAVNAGIGGKLLISTVDPFGGDPGTDLHILTVHWNTGNEIGTSPIEISIINLVDIDTAVIGIPNGITGSVTVTGTGPSPVPGGNGSEAGDVWYVPSRQVVTVGDSVQAEIRLNSGDQSIAAYGLDITYDDSILWFNDIEEGADGFLSAYSLNNPGTIRVSGFDASGTGPGPYLHLLTIYWDTAGTGTTALTLDVNSLANPDTNTIGLPNGIPGEVTVMPETPGVSVKARYLCGSSANLSNMIRPYFNLVNNGSQDVSLHDVTIHYYYSKDGTLEEEFQLTYAEVGDSAVTGTIYADYLQIRFTEEAGILAPQEETGQIICGVARLDGDPYDQSNDYSFDPSFSDYADYRKVALFIGDTLVWGSEPAFSPEHNPPPTPSPTPFSTATPTVTPISTYTPAPTPETSGDPVPGAGDVWFVPDNITVDQWAYFETEIHVNAGNRAIGAYGFQINFDSQIVQVNINEGVEGVSAGPDGFVTVVNPDNPGELIFTGYDTSGKGTGTDVNFVKVHWLAVGPGTTTLELTVNTLVDITTESIGTPNGIGGQVTVIETSPTPDPTQTPEPTEYPGPVEGAGDVWVSPPSQAVNTGDHFTTELHINSGYQEVASFGFEITYNPDIIVVNTAEGNNGVEPGPDGFVLHVNPDTPGILRMSGIDNGTGPGTDLHFHTIHWIAAGEGTTQLDLSVEDLTDYDTNDIGTPNAIDGLVEVADPGETPGAGDVWISPVDQTVNAGGCEIEIRANTGNHPLAAYHFELGYDETVLAVNTEIGTNGVEPGTDGFVAAVNVSTPGLLIFNGYNSSGTGPGTDLHVATVHFTAVDTGISQVILSVDTLVDVTTETIGTPNGTGGTIQVTGPTETPEPTPESTPTPAPPDNDPGTVWFVPADQIVPVNRNFITEVHVNTGTSLLASYGIDISYNDAIITVDTSTGTNGMEEGPDGFVAAVNPNDPGLIRTSGFDASGTGPGADLHVFTIHWIAVNTGTGELILDIRDLNDQNAEVIGVPNGINGTVTVQ